MKNRLAARLAKHKSTFLIDCQTNGRSHKVQDPCNAVLGAYFHASSIKL